VRCEQASIINRKPAVKLRPRSSSTRTGYRAAVYMRTQVRLSRHQHLCSHLGACHHRLSTQPQYCFFAQTHKILRQPQPLSATAQSKMGLLALDIIPFHMASRSMRPASTTSGKHRTTFESPVQASKSKRGQCNVLRKPLHLQPGWKEMSQMPLNE
jgi:hypothetical protein